MGKSKISPRHLLLFLILMLSAGLAAFVVFSTRGSGPERVLEEITKEADLSLKGIRYSETEDGELRWTLEAESVSHDLGEGRTSIESVHMIFYGVEGHGDVTLTASEGVLLTDSREVELIGDVVVDSPRGYTFYTDKLHYRDSEKEFTTDEPVRIVSETMELTGTGMRLDVTDQTFRLLSEVRARIIPGGGES